MSDSDLTDIDDEDVPLALSQASKKAANADGYRIRGALKVPRPTSYTTQALHEQMHSADIDLAAEYQRDVVWPDAKQIGLIDSIFRNFYVPPVIFAVKYESDGGEKRVCIDGKQRLTSIWRFMDGLIPFKDAYTNEKFYYKDVPDRKGKGKLLPEKYRKIFRNKQIVCMEYQDLSPDNEREIFQRVQLGMALTPAEKLQAISSPEVDFVRELLSKYVTGSLASHLAWDTARGSDFRGVAGAVYGIDKWPDISTVPSVPQLSKWLGQKEELDEEFRDKVNQTFQIFVMLAQDEKYRRAFEMDNVKKVSPAEFLATCLLIHAYMNKLTLMQLSEAIRQMRVDIRKVETDIRMNSRVVKHLLAFIKGIKPSKFRPDPGQPMAANIDMPMKKKRKEMDETPKDGEEAGKRKPPARPTPTPRKESKKDPVSSPRLPPTPPASTSSQGRASSSYAPPPPPASAPPLPPPPADFPPPPSRTSSDYRPSPPFGVPLERGVDRLAAVRAAKTAHAQLSSSLPPPARRNGVNAGMYRPSQPDFQDVGMRMLPPISTTSRMPWTQQPQNNLGDSLMARMSAPQSAQPPQALQPQPQSRPFSQPPRHHLSPGGQHSPLSSQFYPQGLSDQDAAARSRQPPPGDFRDPRYGHQGGGYSAGEGHGGYPRR